MRWGLTILYLIATLWAIPVQTLIENGATYDKKTVTITGEVIGDILYRKDCVWINVLAEGTAIGVKTTKNATALIKTTGDYRHRGDIVSVTGTFHRFNKEDLGETMIAANKISLVVPGHTITAPVSLKKAVVAVILVLISLILGFIYTSPLLSKKHKKLTK